MSGFRSVWLRIARVGLLCILLLTGPTRSLFAKDGQDSTIKVVISDAKGAAEGGMFGFEVGGPWGALIGGVIMGGLASLDAANRLGDWSIPELNPLVPVYPHNPMDEAGRRHNLVVFDYLRSGRTVVSATDYLRFIEDSSKKYGYNPGMFSESDFRNMLDKPLVESDSLSVLVRDALSPIPWSLEKDSLATYMVYLLSVFEGYGLQEFDAEYQYLTAGVIANYPDSTKAIAGIVLSVLHNSMWFNAYRSHQTGPVIHIRYGIGLTCWEQQPGMCKIQGPSEIKDDGKKKKKKKKNPEPRDPHQDSLDSARLLYEATHPPIDFVRATTEFKDDTLTVYFSDTVPGSGFTFELADDMHLEFDIAYDIGGHNMKIRKGSYPIDYNSGRRNGLVRIPCVPDGTPGWLHRGQPTYTGECASGPGYCETTYPNDATWVNDEYVPVTLERIDSNIRITFLDMSETKEIVFNVMDHFAFDTLMTSALGIQGYRILSGSYPVDYSRHRMGAVDVPLRDNTTSVNNRTDVADVCSSCTTSYFDLLGREWPQHQLLEGQLYFVIVRSADGHVVSTTTSVLVK